MTTLSQPNQSNQLFPNLKAIIFDLDQTLFDSFSGIVEAHKLNGKENYNLDITEELIREHWGKPVEEFWKILYQNLDTVDNLLKTTLATREKYHIEAKLFNNVKELLNLIKQKYKIGIVTSSNSELVYYMLKKQNIDPNIFCLIQGSEQTDYHKPDYRVFELTKKNLNKIGIKSTEIVYIGDSTHDYLASKGAGIHFIAVLTGLNSKAEFSALGLHDSFIIDRLTDLQNILT